MKILTSLLILLCFTASAFAQPRGWAPFEFSYKTASPAPMCSPRGTEVQAAYNIIARNENPIAVDQALNFLKEYESESPEAVDAVFWLMQMDHLEVSVAVQYGFQVKRDDYLDYLAGLLPITGDYPKLANSIFFQFFLLHVLETDAVYDIQGNAVYPELFAIPHYKEYLCELKYRGCGDLSDVLRIDCSN